MRLSIYALVAGLMSLAIGLGVASASNSPAYGDTFNGAGPLESHTSDSAHTYARISGSSGADVLNGSAVEFRGDCTQKSTFQVIRTDGVPTQFTYGSARIEIRQQVYNSGGANFSVEIGHGQVLTVTADPSIGGSGVRFDGLSGTLDGSMVPHVIDVVFLDGEQVLLIDGIEVGRGTKTYSGGIPSITTLSACGGTFTNTDTYLDGLSITPVANPSPEPTPTPLPADSDGDGVQDSLDQCPNTPAGTSVDDVGCEVMPTPEPWPTPSPELEELAQRVSELEARDSSQEERLSEAEESISILESLIARVQSIVDQLTSKFPWLK